MLRPKRQVELKISIIKISPENKNQPIRVNELRPHYAMPRATKINSTTRISSIELLGSSIFIQ
jgi:hypothetical protein